MLKLVKVVIIVFQFLFVNSRLDFNFIKVVIVGLHPLNFEFEFKAAGFIIKVFQFHFKGFRPRQGLIVGFIKLIIAKFEFKLIVFGFLL